MTKEPKLSAAMRIIPDWGNYDSEIKALQHRVAAAAGGRGGDAGGRRPPSEQQQQQQQGK